MKTSSDPEVRSLFADVPSLTTSQKDFFDSLRDAFSSFGSKQPDIELYLHRYEIFKPFASLFSSELL